MLPNNKKCYKKTFFRFWHFWAYFWQKKTAKIDTKGRKLAKSKLFDNIFWNLLLVGKCFPTKENSTKKLFFDFGLFWPKKTAKIDQKLSKLAKSKWFKTNFQRKCTNLYHTQEVTSHQIS